MVSFTLDQWYGWMNAFLWPFIRMLGLMALAPLLSDSALQNRYKVALAAAVTLAIHPLLPAPPAVPPASWAGLWIAFQQAAIGMALGLTMRIVFAAVQTAGEFIGLQMGLSFASFFDPATGANTTVLARLMNLMALLTFLAIDGHLLLINALVQSFSLLPIGQGPLARDGWGLLLEWSATVMVAGMLLALPMIVVLLSINLALGILNRTAQQLSVFAVGFPISLLVGLLLLTVVLPQTGPFLLRLFQDGHETMARVLHGLAGA